MNCKICEKDLDMVYVTLKEMDRTYHFNEYDDPTATRFLFWIEDYPEVAVCALCLEDECNRGLYFLGLLDDEVKKKQYIEWCEKVKEYEDEHGTDHF